MTGVLTALDNTWDSKIATLLERSRQVSIVRRCVDLADLIATASAGLGSVALVSAELRGLDLSAVVQLRSVGVEVVGLVPGNDEEAERRLRQLEIRRVVAGDSDLATFEAALTEHGGTGRGTNAALDLLDPDLAPDLAPDLDPGLAPDLDPDLRAALDHDLDPDVGSQRRLESDRHPHPYRQSDGRAYRPADPEVNGSRATAPLDAADKGEMAFEVAAQPPGRIVAVWGPTGAPGRTTIAVTLASELAALDVPTVLVDADTYGGSVAQALSFLDEAPGLAAATRAADQGTLDLPLLARLAPTASKGMRVLTGIPKAERWTEIRPAALERVLTLSRSLARTVVVDCGFNLEQDEELSYDTTAPRRNAATLTALGLADEIVVVGACDPVGLQRLVRALQELGTVVHLRPVVLVNRVRASAVGKHPEATVSEALRRFAGVDDLVFVPDDRPSLDAALLQGRALAECAPASPVRAAVQALAARVASVPQNAGSRGRRRRVKKTAARVSR
jgi:MinD-like ATPase involved in chromosome partitioning or flagellar assembly